MEVAIGVDSHKASFTAAAVDGMGRSLGNVTLPNDPQGIDALGVWMKRYPEHVIGIEGSQRYGKALAKGLEVRGESVFEVPASLTGRERKRRRNDGKSDPVDAAAIARVVARGEGLAVARRDDVCVDLKLLLDHRDQLVHTRTELVNQTHSDLVVLAPGYQKKVPNLTTMSNLETAEALTRGDSSVRAQLVRRRIAGIKHLEAEIALLTKEIQAKLKESKSTLTEIPGVGPLVAARILGEVGDPSRIRSRAAFAVITGTAPLEVSSGAVKRHRLNRQGNRQLNQALYVVAMTQARMHPPACDYMAKKRAEGKSYRESLRCLKRNLANVVYRRLVQDSRLQIAA